MASFFVLKSPYYLHFFTHTSNHLINVLTEIHILVKHGRYTFNDLWYHIPISFRKYFFHMLEVEKEEVDKARENAIAQMKTGR